MRKETRERNRIKKEADIVWGGRGSRERKRKEEEGKNNKIEEGKRRAAGAGGDR